MTGTLSEMGQYESEAMKLAHQQMLPAEKQQIELIFEDGKGDSKSAVNAASKLININKVDALITSTTGASLAVQPLADLAHVPLIAFCMASDVAAKSPNTVRYYIGIEEESAAIISYLKTLPSETKVGILNASVAVWNTSIQESYRPFLTSHFRSSPLIEEYPLACKDFRPQLSRIKQANTQVLIILGYGFEYGPLFSQLDEMDMRKSLQIIGGWGFLYTSLSKETMEGIRVAGPTYVFDRGKQGAKFESDYRQTTGRMPNFDAAFGYEVITKIPLLISIRRSNDDFKKALAGKGPIEGVMGRYHFTESGNMIVETALGVFRDGILSSK